MKRQRHKHKESFSILLISNTGQSSRQYHVSLFLFRLFVFLLLLICVALGGVTFLFTMEYGKRTNLQQQVISQSQLVAQLESEKNTLNNENLALTAENDGLRQAAIVNAEEETAEPEQEPEPESSPSFPSRYPCSGTGILTTTYSEEHPFLSSNTQAEGNIIAAGDGTVTSIGSDDTYPLIMEIEHGNGYRTRYMCLQNAEVKVEQGAQVHIGDVLIMVTTNDTQLDYQVIFEEQAIDPLTIIDAEG